MLSVISTSYKSRLAMAKVVIDLTQKGYRVFRDILADDLPFDLIAYKENRYYRIQCKYSCDGQVRRGLTWKKRFNQKKTNIIHNYQGTEFDYFAIYLSKKNVVIYPAIKFAGATIRTETASTLVPFYYFEDFIEFTDEASKRSYKDFGIARDSLQCFVNRKNIDRKNWPETTKFIELVNSHTFSQVASLLGVSISGVRQRCVKLGIKRIRAT